MNQPPSLRAPRFIQTIQFKARPLAYLDACAERYGDIFTAGSERSSRLYVSRPAAIQEILTADRELFAPFRGDSGSRFLFGESSLVFLEGEEHQRERRLLTPALHGERLRANGHTICDITNQVVDRWRRGEPVFVSSTMQEITLQVIFRVMFDAGEEPRLLRLRQLMGRLLSSLSSPLGATLVRLSEVTRRPLGQWRRLARMKRDIDQLVYDEIRERRVRGRLTGDLLGLLMSARDTAGEPMTDREVHDEVMTLLFAGHETTASALAWALYWLHESPGAQDTLRQELGGLAAGASPTDISQLPYLTAVCQETLRLKPPALSALRIPKKPLEIAGYRVAAGTSLIISIYLTHRRRDLYPEPERFQPERFVGRQYSPYEYLPFGGGHRLCLGMALALLEMKLVLATILSRWQLATADRRPVKHSRRLLTAGPSGHMRLIPIHQCGGLSLG